MGKKRRRRATKTAPSASPPLPATTTPEPPAAWSVGRRPAIAVLAALSVGALLARVVAIWDHVFPATGQIRLLGVDPYFHLRHARFIAHHFPTMQRWDIATHYPDGQRSGAVSLFDLAMGTVAWLIGLGDPSDRVVDYVAVWTPPVLSTLAVVLLYLLARTVLDRLPALVASAVFVLYPGSSLHRAMLGFADHHVAEIALALLTVWALTRFAQNCEQFPAAQHWWRPAFAPALPLAVFAFTWAGAPIFLLFALIALFVVGTIEIAHGARQATTAHTALRYGSALLIMVGLAAVVFPDLVMSRRRLPNLLFGCAAIGVGPAVYLYAARALVSRWGRPQLIAALAAAALVAVAAVIVWQSPVAGRYALLLLAQKGKSLAEHRVVDWMLYWRLLGIPGVVALAAVPLGLWRAVRRSQDRLCLLPLTFGALLIGLWVISHDYDYTPPVFVALLATFVLAEIADRLSTWRIVRVRWVIPTVLAVILVAPIWPLKLVLLPWSTVQVGNQHLVINDAWEESMAWMRDNTPQPSLAIDAQVEPFGGGGALRHPPDTYGVFSPWDFGNMISALGERVPVWSRWPSKRTARWVVCEDEEESLELLCPTCEEGEHVRYVVLEARTVADHFAGKVQQAGRRLEDYDTKAEKWYAIGENEKIPHRTYGPRYERSMAVRLYLGDGRDVGHYRLVFESPHASYIPYLLQFETYKFKRIAYGIASEAQREAYSKRSRIGHVVRSAAGHYEYDGVITPSVKIFERVAGARLRGLARAGATVEARLPLRCGPEDREVDYRRTATSAPDGRFELILAHASKPTESDGACRASARYTLYVTDAPGAKAVKVGTVAVDDRQVRRGSRLDLGRMR